MSFLYDAIQKLDPIKRRIFGEKPPINPINLIPGLPKSLKANYLGPSNALDADYIRTHPPTGFADAQALTHDRRYNLSEKTKASDPKEASLIQRGADLRMVKNLERHMYDPNAGWGESLRRNLHPQNLLGLYGIRGKMLVEDLAGHKVEHNGEVIGRNHDVIPGYRRGTGPQGLPMKPGSEKMLVKIHKGEIVLTRGNLAFAPGVARRENVVRKSI